MQKTNMHKFQVDIWFESFPNTVQLGKVNVYAESETKALELAMSNTHYAVSGVDGVTWEVRERAVKCYVWR